MNRVPGRFSTRWKSPFNLHSESRLSISSLLYACLPGIDLFSVTRMKRWNASKVVETWQSFGIYIETPRSSIETSCDARFLFSEIHGDVTGREGNKRKRLPLFFSFLLSSLFSWTKYNWCIQRTLTFVFCSIRFITDRHCTLQYISHVYRNYFTLYSSFTSKSM